MSCEIGGEKFELLEEGRNIPLFWWNKGQMTSSSAATSSSALPLLLFSCAWGERNQEGILANLQKHEAISLVNN